MAGGSRGSLYPVEPAPETIGAQGPADAMTWWMVVLIVLGALLAGGLAVFVWLLVALRRS